MFDDTDVYRCPEDRSVVCGVAFESPRTAWLWPRVRGSGGGVPPESAPVVAGRPLFRP